MILSYKFSGDVYAGRSGQSSCGCDDYDVYGGQNGCGCDDYTGQSGREGQGGANCSYECGRNRACDDQLVLAIATVPMQKWRLTYSPEKALCAGTMFAELNLPFKGGKCR